MQRSKYTPEFKSEAVKQVVDKGHTVVDVASRLGLGEGVLYNWVRKSKAADGVPLGDMRAMQAEVAKLKAELRRTTEERDILKKAAAYFAKQSGGSTRSFKPTDPNSNSPACAASSGFTAVASMHGCTSRYHLVPKSTRG